MADRLIRGQVVGTTVARVVVSAFCLVFSAFCCAEELPDPTRPPASLAAQIIAPASGVAVSQSPGLQSIIISRKIRAAIIDGETVELGGKYGDAQLVEINDNGVVLMSAQGKQELTLFPDVRMTGSGEMKTKPQPATGRMQTGGQEYQPVAR